MPHLLEIILCSLWSLSQGQEGHFLQTWKHVVRIGPGIPFSYSLAPIALNQIELTVELWEHNANMSPVMKECFEFCLFSAKSEWDKITFLNPSSLMPGT